MEIIIRGEKIDITDSMKAYAKEKLSKISKYIENGDEVKANVLFKLNGVKHKLEITIRLPKLVLRVEEENEDFYAAVDTSIDKLERQIRKNKTKLERRRKQQSIKEFNLDFEEPEENKSKIVKRKIVEAKPMDEEEAILQMELIGHDFFLYKDAETSKPTVVYKRKNGNYGLIEVE